MDKTMIPSADCISAKQIAKIQSSLAVGLRRAGFLRKPIQQIIEHELAGLTTRIVDTVRDLATTKIFFRSLKTPVDVSADEIPGIAGRHQNIDWDVVKTMPRSCGATRALFFNLNRPLADDDELEKEYRLRGPAIDPYTLGEINKEDPTFSKQCPNATHWRDGDGKWCYIAFYQWGDKPCVSVSRGNGWHPFWSFGVADTSK